MTALLVSTVLPYLITKFGGMFVSSMLLKAGVGQSLAANGGSIISQIAAKLAGGKPLSAPEKTVWNAHVQTNYVPTPQPQAVAAVEVASAAGVPFAQL
jgi:hypothetical protein